MSSDQIQLLVSLAIQTPQVIALIYLVIKLEESRFKAIQARDEIHRHTVDALIGLLEETFCQRNPDRLTARQFRAFQDHLDALKRAGVGNQE